MTMLIMDTATAPRTAVDNTLRSSALAGWWPDAAGACMAARIIGTGRPAVYPSRFVQADGRQSGVPCHAQSVCTVATVNVVR